MKTTRLSGGKISSFLLLTLCVTVMILVFLIIAPNLQATISMAREYGVEPDNWTYFAILGACFLVLISSLFLLFHQYILRKNQREQ